MTKVNASVECSRQRTFRLQVENARMVVLGGFSRRCRSVMQLLLQWGGVTPLLQIGITIIQKDVISDTPDIFILMLMVTTPAAVITNVDALNHAH